MKHDMIPGRKKKPVVHANFIEGESLDCYCDNMLVTFIQDK